MNRSYLIYFFLLWITAIHAQKPIDGYQSEPVYHEGRCAGYRIHLVDKSHKLPPDRFVSDLEQKFKIGKFVRTNGSVILRNEGQSVHIYSRAVISIFYWIEFKDGHESFWVRDVEINWIVPMKCDDFRLVKKKYPPLPKGSPLVDLGEYEVECNGVSYPISILDKFAYDTGNYHLMRSYFGSVFILGNHPDIVPG